MMKTKPLTKSGIVQSFNVSPKGSYEGLLLESKEGIVQINFPQELALSVAKLAPVCETIKAVVEEMEAKHDANHPVYALVSLKNSGGLTLSLETKADGEDEKFEGKVERLNYARHGEVNGGILDSGDFLHLKPHGARAVKLAPGLAVKGTGMTKPMVGGYRVIEAGTVNGIRIEEKPKPKKHAAAH
jgi:hypothetical protein